MNNARMWAAVDPSPTEIEAASAAFEGLNVTDILPRLVMVRRAVVASFYTDDLPRPAEYDPAA
ncbi:MAG: hypothetical protein JO057_01705 [Chloroflexi bacterium]|nr:hypothetical protein [Chloroflexota bacterium]